MKTYKYKNRNMNKKIKGILFFVSLFAILVSPFGSSFSLNVAKAINDDIICPTVTPTEILIYFHGYINQTSYPGKDYSESLAKFKDELAVITASKPGTIGVHPDNSSSVGMWGDVDIGSIADEAKTQCNVTNNLPVAIAGHSGGGKPIINNSSFDAWKIILLDAIYQPDSYTTAQCSKIRIIDGKSTQTYTPPLVNKCKNESGFVYHENKTSAIEHFATRNWLYEFYLDSNAPSTSSGGAPATPALSTSELSPTSVYLNASGLTPSMKVAFTVSNSDSNTPTYFMKSPSPEENANGLVITSGSIITADKDGKASYSFQNLTPRGTYIGVGTDAALEPTTIQSITFSTPFSSTPKLSVFQTTSTSVVLEADKYTPKKDMTFHLTSMPASITTEKKDEIQIAKTDDSGTAISPSFDKLTPGGQYQAELSYTDNVNTILDRINSIDLPEDLGPSATLTSSGTPTNATDTWTEIPAVPAAGLFTGCPAGGCGWNEFMALVNKLINYILIYLAVPLAAIMFVYAGGLMVTSGGSPESRNKAKEIFINVGIGIFCIAGSWIIIHTIFLIFGYSGSWIGL